MKDGKLKTSTVVLQNGFLSSVYPPAYDLNTSIGHLPMSFADSLHVRMTIRGFGGRSQEYMVCNVANGDRERKVKIGECRKKVGCRD